MAIINIRYSEKRQFLDNDKDRFDYELEKTIYVFGIPLRKLNEKLKTDSSRLKENTIKGFTNGNNL